MNTNSSITSSDWLTDSIKKLKLAGIGSARLDAILILERVLGLSRISIISGDECIISKKDLDKLNALLLRRLKDEPMAYIQGHTEFYGREFSIDSKVLVPRPESEVLLDLLKNLPYSEPSILDIGCGSGCIGISIKLEMPGSKVTLLDISNDALEIARKNATTLKADVAILKQDLISKNEPSYDIYVVNLPYVPDSMKKSKNLAFEPPIALFSGNNGMDMYKKFWDKVSNLTYKPAYIFCESLTSQHNAMTKLAEIANYHTEITRGLVQQFKLF